MTRQVTASAAITLAVLMSSLEKRIIQHNQAQKQSMLILNTVIFSLVKMEPMKAKHLHTSNILFKLIHSINSTGTRCKHQATHHFMNGITLYHIWHQVHFPLMMTLLQRSRPSRKNPLSLSPKNPSLDGFKKFVSKSFCTQGPTAISWKSERAHCPGQPSNNRHVCSTCI